MGDINEREFEMYQKLVDGQICGLEKEVKHNFDIVHYTLEQILEQTKKTNGRVTKMEEETAMVRFFEKHKVLTLFVGGAFIVSTVFGIISAISKIL